MRTDAHAAICVFALGASLAALLAYPGSMRPYTAKFSIKPQNEETPGIVPAEPDTRFQKRDPVSLAELFRHPSIEIPQASGEAAPAPGAEPVQANWLKLLGEITDGSGIVRLYFKDTIKGTMHRFRADGKDERAQALVGENSNEFVLSIDGDRYRVARSKR